MYIQTYSNQTVKTIPGHGLLPEIEKEDIIITKNLADLVSSKSKPTLTHLNDISSNDVLITGDVITAVQRMDPAEQAVAISKLSSEASMSRIVEKALIIRRMLITGNYEPNISQTPATSYIKDSIEQLDRSIDNIMFEKRLHTELASQTPALILKFQEQHENRTGAYQDAAASEDQVVEDGAIK